tara:strand:+ start:1856 stop:2359 length:504 start_codon:yes stop_codon:yes gene_type:complete
MTKTKTIIAKYGKTADLQKKLIAIDESMRSIEAERQGHRADEYDKGKEQLRKLSSKIVQAHRLACLDHIMSMRTPSRELTGNVVEHCYISLGTGGVHDAQSGRFTVINAHRGRKHLGFWIRFDGSSKNTWLPFDQIAGGMATIDGYEYPGHAVAGRDSLRRLRRSMS